MPPTKQNKKAVSSANSSPRTKPSRSFPRSPSDKTKDTTRERSARSVARKKCKDYVKSMKVPDRHSPTKTVHALDQPDNKNEDEYMQDKSRPAQSSDGEVSDQDQDCSDQNSDDDDSDRTDTGTGTSNDSSESDTDFLPVTGKGKERVKGTHRSKDHRSKDKKGKHKNRKSPNQQMSNSRHSMSAIANAASTFGLDADTITQIALQFAKTVASEIKSELKAVMQQEWSMAGSSSTSTGSSTGTGAGHKRSATSSSCSSSPDPEVDAAFSSADGIEDATVEQYNERTGKNISPDVLWTRQDARDAYAVHLGKPKLPSNMEIPLDFLMRAEDGKEVSKDRIQAIQEMIRSATRDEFGGVKDKRRTDDNGKKVGGQTLRYYEQHHGARLKRVIRARGDVRF
ncbi:hypothetical protein CF326_g9119 [Tilletia indica]|nr:hypothetical protein CF326_g9119 [Tilletia indica]